MAPSRALAASRKRRSAAERRRLKVVGLFAGIGGIELGLHAAEHETILLCELDPGARAVLDDRFPNIEKRNNVCDLRSLPADAELLAAGFPCQDLSQAGMTAGIEGARSGLIEEVFRLLRRRRVPWVLLENVPFMLQLGGGRALGVIIRGLEGLGYRWAYRIVNSLAFGVPQRRERVFLVACLDDDPRRVLLADDVGVPEPPTPSPDLAFGFYWTEGVRGLGAAVDAVPTLKGGSTVGIPSPPAIMLPGGSVVTPTIRDVERLQGFAAGWTEPAERAARKTHRWKLVGNAVTVPVSAWLGERLAAPGEYDASLDAPLLPEGRWPSAAWSFGSRRFAATVSTWPVRRRRPHLHDFLVDPVPLSVKATAGFWSRFQMSTLRRPLWFDARLVEHLRRMKRFDKRRRTLPESECHARKQRENQLSDAIASG